MAKKSNLMQKSNDPFGLGYGKGHSGKSQLPEPTKREMTEGLMALVLSGNLPPETTLYTLNQCTILVSKPTKISGWILSISHPSRYPTWDEIAKARYSLLPHDLIFVMPLPSPDDYVNVHANTFQLHEGSIK